MMRMLSFFLVAVVSCGGHEPTADMCHSPTDMTPQSSDSAPASCLPCERDGILNCLPSICIERSPGEFCCKGM